MFKYPVSVNIFFHNERERKTRTYGHYEKKNQEFLNNFYLSLLNKSKDILHRTEYQFFVLIFCFTASNKPFSQQILCIGMNVSEIKRYQVIKPRLYKKNQFFLLKIPAQQTNAHLTTIP